MKRILFCTDLTEHSNSALEFSIEIAKKTHAKIIAVHSYFVPLEEGPFIPFSIDLARIEESQKMEVDKICSKIRSYEYPDTGTLECDQIVALNYPELEILNEANKLDVDLIIMGSRPVLSLQKWFGTTSTQVTEKSERPVLIVPENIKFTGFNNIIYATDLKEEKTKVLDVIQFGKLFNGSITVLHIGNPEEEATDQLKFGVFQERIMDLECYPLLKFDFITYKDVIPALIEYVKHKDADLLVVRKHQYPFFEKLFCKSVSNELVFNSEFPVLIVH